jgi:hypothetical protein
MAGLGRKVFTAGDVLTASDVQNYLQDQSVMVFAGTAARSSAIATPSEGMFAITTDDDELDYYNGSAWVPALPLGAWRSYTPVWGSNGTQPVLGNSIFQASFCQIGKTVHFKIRLELVSGAGFSIGTGTRYTFSLPVNNSLITLGQSMFFDSSTNAFYLGLSRINATAVDASWNSLGPSGLTSNLFGSSTPVVPAAGDQYYLSGTYESV